MTRQECIIKNRFFSVILLMAGLFLLNSCAGVQQAYHSVVMKGSIIETTDEGSIYLCIGKKDGASVGQELDVYKITSIQRPKLSPQFKREKTGRVRITEIVDEHFATAVILSGKAEKHDVAELDR